MEINLGDNVRDIEDIDCYYEGVVVHLNPIMYEITNIVRFGEQDTTENGKVTTVKWWHLEIEGN